MLLSETAGAKAYRPRLNRYGLHRRVKTGAGLEARPFGSDLDGPAREAAGGQGVSVVLPDAVRQAMQRDGRHQPGGARSGPPTRKSLQWIERRRKGCSRRSTGSSKKPMSWWSPIMRASRSPRCKLAQADEGGGRHAYRSRKTVSPRSLFKARTCVDRGPAYGTDPDRLFGRSDRGAESGHDFAKAHEKFVILGGAMGKTALDPNGVKALATLPSLDELRAKLVGLSRRRRPRSLSGQRAGGEARPRVPGLRPKSDDCLTPARLTSPTVRTEGHITHG